VLGLSRLYHFFDLIKGKTLYSLSEVFGHLFIKIYLAVLFLQNIALWTFVWLFSRRIGDSLAILHFNVDFGIDLAGDAHRLFNIPILGSFISVFNFLLLFIFLKNKNFKFIAYLILSATALVNFFLSLALGPIYWMNFR
jgi:hypothetical protein